MGRGWECRHGMGFFHPYIKNPLWNFPGCPVVKTLGFHCRGAGSIPGQGTKIPHTIDKKKKDLKKKKKGLFMIEPCEYAT